MDVTSYIQGFSEPQRSILLDVRAKLEGLLPSAQQAISYGMPVFKLAGKPVLYFAA